MCKRPICAERITFRALPQAEALSFGPHLREVQPTATGTTPYLTTFMGLAKVWTFCPVVGNHFLRPPQKGKETVKKYTTANVGFRKTPAAGLAPARVT